VYHDEFATRGEIGLWFVFYQPGTLRPFAHCLLVDIIWIGEDNNVSTAADSNTTVFKEKVSYVAFLGLYDD
jgi:hypothetical protein